MDMKNHSIKLIAHHLLHGHCNLKRTKALGPIFWCYSFYLPHSYSM